jgi:hypothetical protein
MKAKLILSALAVSLLALSSCKKDYNCNCSIGGFSGDGEKYYDVTKGDAESKCEEYEADAQAINSSFTCKVVEAE